MTLLGGKDDRLRYAVGWAIGLFTFIVYNLTRAPTLSFWDCGEFIASSYILGIPHPPGTPLYVLIARVFTFFPTSSDVAARVNLISALTSAGAAIFAFFVLFRALRGALGENLDTYWKAPACYVGAITGTLFMAFSNTHWNNAVETEVYGPSMLVIMAVIWLAMRWKDTKETPRGDRYLIAIAYVAFASIGIHLTAFMVVPPVLLFIMLADRRLRSDWRFWITGLVFLTAASSFELFGICWLAWTAVAAIAALNVRQKKAWVLILLLLGAAFVGYTNQLYIPIRSAQNPNIDENNPEDLASFRYFLGRKQYGSDNMITRMFHRRGNPLNQFGDHARMGFWRFFKTQYGFNYLWFLPFFALGIFGCLWLYSRHRLFAALLCVMLLASSVGLVLYMNFADGARYDGATGDAYIEVRDRDYFFTPAYTFFGLMMGVGLAGLMQVYFQKRKRAGSPRLAWTGLVLVLLPLYQMRANWASCDRHGDVVPWDYAYNILNFCEPNAILFTSGDNDTFPVWCLQDAFGVRRDVAVVNLSLAQTDWYILQMRDQWGLPVTWTTDQIKWAVPVEITDRAGRTQILYRPKEKYYDPISKTYEYLFPRSNREAGGILSTSDMVIEHLLENNHWKRPVYFSGGVSGKSRLHLENHAVQKGILYQVVPYEAHQTFDADTNAILFGDVCRYRGVDDLQIYRSESTIGNLLIYPEKFLQIADAYLRRGDTTKAITWAHKAAATFPHYWRGFMVLADYYEMRGDSATVDSVLQAGDRTFRFLLDFNPDNRYYYLSYGLLAERMGNAAAAQKYLAEAFYLNPSDALTFQPLLIFCQQHSLNEEAVRAARKWLEYYPGDQLAQQIVTYGGVK